MDCFEIDQVLALLAAARAESETDWLMLAVAFLFALRAHEVVRIKGDDVIDGYLTVRRGKKSKPVRRPIPNLANELFSIRKPLLLLARKQGSKKLFPISTRTLQRRVHKYGELAGLPDLLSHPHTLKHSILTYLAQFMPLHELQQISGHRDLDSLQVYLHAKSVKVEEKYLKAFEGL